MGRSNVLDLIIFRFLCNFFFNVRFYLLSFGDGVTFRVKVIIKQMATSSQPSVNSSSLPLTCRLKVERVFLPVSPEYIEPEVDLRLFFTLLFCVLTSVLFSLL